jgi:hypothetical protein
MNDPLLDIPRELAPSFEDWKANYADYAWQHDSSGIEEYDGRNVPQPWNRGSIEALREKGISVRCRMG